MVSHGLRLGTIEVPFLRRQACGCDELPTSPALATLITTTNKNKRSHLEDELC